MTRVMREALTAIDRTNWLHAAVALTMQMAVLSLFGWLNFNAALAAGTVLGIGFFAGREHAQAEARQGQGHDFLAVLRACDMRRWDWNSRWDLIFPVVACALGAAVALLVG